ncbi:MAG: hypothetical protein RL264_2759 [Bacteroidota bacterium]|jgi:hypothetical protein
MTTNIIIGIVVSGTFLIGFATLLILGIIRKNMTMVIVANVLFFLAVASSLVAASLVAEKGYEKLKKSFKGRTGVEMYTAILGIPDKCVKIVNKQDQTLPKIDVAISLEAQICSDELKRLLQREKYVEQRIASKELRTYAKWMQPTKWGDTLTVYYLQRDEMGNDQFLYLKPDKSRIYVVDVWD